MKTGKMTKMVAIVVLFLAVTLVPMPTSAQNSMVDLGIPYTDWNSANAINELDQIVGYGNQNSLFFGFLWESGSSFRIYGIGDWYTVAHDINDWRQVVGESYSRQGYYRAFLWENGVATDLGVLGGFISDARAINNLGQVVGYSQTDSGGPYAGPGHAFLWEDGVMSDLGTLGGTWSGAYDINDLSQVVGYSQTGAGEAHAFLWENGVMTDLGTLGGTFSMANAINDLGQVVGESTTASGESHAFLWENGVMTDLGTLGQTHSLAADINNLSQVVGYSYTVAWEDRRAFLWENGVMTDLGTMGGATSQAMGINDLGHIVGESETSAGVRHAYVWTYVLQPPTPEERISALEEQIDALVAGGSINEGQGNALRSKLDSVLRHLDADNAGAACSLLQAFGNQVDSLIRAGLLTAEAGQPLIDGAVAVSSELCP